MKRHARSTSPHRSLWSLDPRVAFLNHGSFGACPKPILQLQTRLRQEMEREPVQFLWRRFEERLDPSRRVLARFLHARERDLAFVPNATAGINAVARSYPLRPGDVILTTDHAYNACRNAIAQAARDARARVVVARVPFPLRHPDDVLASILDALTPRTRLAMIDHVTSPTALVFPIERIVRELEARGVDTLVDGAHAPGMLPIDLARLRPAYYTGNLHKWVCAPKGAGFLWVRDDLQDAVQPPIISHGNNTPRPGYSAFNDRFDWIGTLDPTPWFCAGPAIEWMGALLPGGWAELRRRNRQLILAARRALLDRLEVAAPCPEQMLGSMATLPLPAPLQNRPRAGRIDPEQSRLHDEFGAEIMLYRFGTPDLRYFRVSAQIYNSIEEYESLADSLLAVCRT